MRVDASSVDSTECRHGNAVCGVAGGHCSSPALFLELVEQTFFESHTGPGGDPFDLLSRGTARARTRFSHRDGVCKLHLPDWFALCHFGWHPYQCERRGDARSECSVSNRWRAGFECSGHDWPFTLIWMP